MKPQICLLSVAMAVLVQATSPKVCTHSIPESRNLKMCSQKQAQEASALVDTMGQTETTDNGALDNTTTSLRAGKRGYVLLEDTMVRKKMLHFDRERAPERVVHALGHAAYGKQLQIICATLRVYVLTSKRHLHPLRRLE